MGVDQMQVALSVMAGVFDHCTKVLTRRPWLANALWKNLNYLTGLTLPN